MFNKLKNFVKEKINDTKSFVKKGVEKFKSIFKKQDHKQNDSKSEAIAESKALSENKQNEGEDEALAEYREYLKRLQDMVEERAQNLYNTNSIIEKYGKEKGLKIMDVLDTLLDRGLLWYHAKHNKTFEDLIEINVGGKEKNGDFIEAFSRNFTDEDLQALGIPKITTDDAGGYDITDL